MELYQNRKDRPRVYTGTGGTVPYRTASGTRIGTPRKYVPHRTEIKCSCKLPEPFSSGTLGNEARGNSTEES